MATKLTKTLAVPAALAGVFAFCAGFIVLAVKDYRAERSAFIASCEQSMPYWRCTQEWECQRGNAISCLAARPAGLSALKEQEKGE